MKLQYPGEFDIEVSTTFPFVHFTYPYVVRDWEPLEGTMVVLSADLDTDELPARVWYKDFSHMAWEEYRRTEDYAYVSRQGTYRTLRITRNFRTMRDQRKAQEATAALWEAP